MLSKILKDYFSFTKRERIAVIILVFVILILFLLPYGIPGEQDRPDKDSLEQFQRQLANLKPSQQDVLNEAERTDDSYPSLDEPRSPKEYAHEKGELFYFDPNNLSPGGWKKLGLPDKTIHTIQNYISKGGVFRNSEDLRKIYGLREDQVKRLLPYVRLVNKGTDREDHNKPPNVLASDAVVTRPAKYSKSPLDVNLSDTSAFISLRGIGPRLALRIVRFREKLGGFHSIDQVAEVFGLPDSTFQQIKPQLTISSYELVTININTAEVSALQQHPYLKWNIANAIVEYRRQHGEFKQTEDLRQIDVISPELFRKIAPYLTVK